MRRHELEHIIRAAAAVTESVRVCRHSTTATLPAGWQDRLVRLQSENTNGRVGYCLDPTDLFLAKCVANRDKDRGFNKALLRHGIVNAAVALKRAKQMPLPEARQTELMARIRGLERSSL